MRVGVDTGGTFTDFVFQTKDGLRVFKLASTPADPSEAITEGLRRIADLTAATLRDIEVIHGTTVGTNALLERRGARTALVTTAGFEDVLAIGRQARPALYDLNAVKPEPLVPDNLRFGVKERIAASGEVLEELSERALGQLVKKLKRARVESIAVCCSSPSSIPGMSGASQRRSLRSMFHSPSRTKFSRSIVSTSALRP